MSQLHFQCFVNYEVRFVFPMEYFARHYAGSLLHLSSSLRDFFLFKLSPVDNKANKHRRRKTVSRHEEPAESLVDLVPVIKRSDTCASICFRQPVHAIQRRLYKRRGRCFLRVYLHNVKTCFSGSHLCNSIC